MKRGANVFFAEPHLDFMRQLKHFDAMDELGNHWGVKDGVIVEMQGTVVEQRGIKSAQKVL
jgi:hypothetical protein